MIMTAVLWFLAQYAIGHTKVLGDVGHQVFNLFSKIIQGGKVPFTVLVTFVSFGLFSKLKQQKKVRLESECGGFGMARLALNICGFCIHRFNQPWIKNT